MDGSIDCKSVLINLKILGKVDTGMKINVKNTIFTLDENGWKAMVTRKWRGDDRDQTYDKISKLVEDVTKLLDREQFSNDIYRNLLNEAVDFKNIIEASIEGLTKLKGTYIDDKTFVAKIEIEIGLLNRLFNKIKTNDKLKTNDKKTNDEIDKLQIDKKND